MYLGAGGFNARDDGAQLTLDELESACTIAHAHGVRIYFTLNVLVKPAELVPALELLSTAWTAASTQSLYRTLGSFA